MTSNKSIDFRLYLITDRKLFSSSDAMLTAIEQALSGGVRAVQLREKDLSIRDLLDLAYRLRELTARYGARLFINDRVDIAVAVEADGVHLGTRSMPVYAARRVSPGRLMIGVSTHGMDEAKAAEQDGADFVTLGPVFETPSKMQYGRPIGLQVLKEVTDVLSIPVFALGGARTDRVDEVLRCGAAGIAMISAILAAGDVRKTTEEFMRKLS